MISEDKLGAETIVLQPPKDLESLSYTTAQKESTCTFSEHEAAMSRLIVVFVFRCLCPCGEGAPTDSFSVVC